MGIESDQLVFDYLSRVGDVAQQRQLPSGTRMRLVSGLRGEIDRRRAGAADSPAAIRRILDGLGTPDELVDAAADHPDDISAAIPEQREEPQTSRLRRVVPRPRLRPATDRPAATDRPTAEGPARPATERPERPARPVRPTKDRPTKGRPARPAKRRPAPDSRPDPRPAPPHLAGTDELGVSGADLEPDWWRVDNTPAAGKDTVHGFVGGVEIPEMLKRPVSTAKPGPGEVADAEDEYDEEEGYEEEGYEADDDEAVEAAPRGRFRRLLAPAVGAAPDEDTDEEAPAKEAPSAKGANARAGVARALSNPVVLLAAIALVVGAVIGNWFALAGGWAVAYFAPKLSPAEKKVGVFVMPGLAIAAGVGWLWGRSQGKWGEPIVKGHMNEAVADTWPWVVRGAAVATALFLVWRSQRQRPSAE
ncbi:hypothetical protein [Streptomyces flavofungini]|uniref:Integral membrane protein n=1 Tax=Streptomyces flavofungini TaxID=68200 RepID=A0ABS0X132_9ACTN|nr:hypothetical protein [Streptomyces flavofungini]MBJ3806871.1 hypothetical protein [Streptomyces flavofungini]GHC60010.1 membrane protein [Streptomyces flavofungini]